MLRNAQPRRDKLSQRERTKAIWGVPQGRPSFSRIEELPERASETRVTEALYERIAACLEFCSGIPTETLKRELPLASARRHEIAHLRRALPWLPMAEENEELRSRA